MGIHLRKSPSSGAAYVVAGADAPDHIKAQAHLVCDGSHDEVEIQAAIDALPAGGGSVYLTGIFEISEHIDVRSDLEVYGDKSTVLRATADNPEFIFYSPPGYAAPYTASPVLHENITIRDLKIECQRNMNRGSSYHAAVHLCYTSHTRLIRVHVDDVNSCGINIDGVTALTDDHLIQNCRITNSLLLAVGIRDCYTNNTRVVNNYLSQVRQPILTCCGTQHLVQANHIVQTGTVGRGALCIGAFIAPGAVDIRILDNFIQSPRDAVTLIGSWDQPYKNLMIARNTILGAASYSGIITQWERDGAAAHIENMKILHNYIRDCNVGINITRPASEPNIDLEMLHNYFENCSTDIHLDAGVVLNYGRGPRLESSGQATVPSGSTSVVVDHGLADTPARVLLTARAWGDAAKAWVSDLTSTQFTINVDADPGADIDFDWRATIGEG